MKHLTYLSFFLVLGLNLSCKKGCTDPYAKNYNAKKTIDKGNCNHYSKVTLNSIYISEIPELNQDSEPWDNATNNDLDNDGTHPDLYIEYRAENGYTLEPASYLPTVNPSNVDWLYELEIPLKQENWKDDKGFYVTFYEVDNNGTYEVLMDSILIRPFDYHAKYNRFRDTLELEKNNIKFTAHMKWE